MQDFRFLCSLCIRITTLMTVLGVICYCFSNKALGPDSASSSTHSIRGDPSSAFFTILSVLCRTTETNKRALSTSRQTIWTISTIRMADFGRLEHKKHYFEFFKSFYNNISLNNWVKEISRVWCIIFNRILCWIPLLVTFSVLVMVDRMYKVTDWRTCKERWFKEGVVPSQNIRSIDMKRYITWIVSYHIVSVS